MRFGPDFVLELCIAIGAAGGLAVGYITGYLLPCGAVGLAAGLAVGAKLNPDNGDSPN